jgi:hypothetical protein
VPVRDLQNFNLDAVAKSWSIWEGDLF